MKLDINYFVIMPQIILTFFFLLQLVLDAYSKSSGNKSYVGYVGFVGYGLLMLFAIVTWGTKDSGFYGMVKYDTFAQFFDFLISMIGMLVVLIAPKYLDEAGRERGEFYSLLTASLIGMSIMVATTNLILFLIALEIMSLAVYVMAGFEKEKKRSTEAAFKYFIMGGVGSAFFLFGTALLYASTKSVDVVDVIGKFAAVSSCKFFPAFLGGLTLVLIGFLFKVAAVPFHMWTPDAYEGAPTPATAFMAVGVKAAAFAGLLRILIITVKPYPHIIEAVIWSVAFLTMFVGNFMAVIQDNVKRMLAYSSIAHAGYMLVGVLAYAKSGMEAVLFYLLVYALADIGAFAVLIALGKDGEPVETIEQVKGKASIHPLLGAAMIIFMFSLAGVPPMAGFFGKFFIFKSAIAAGYVWLAVLGILTSVVSLYYYLRVLVYMYMYSPEDVEPAKPSISTGIGLAVMAALVLYLGTIPVRFIDIAINAVKQIL